MEDSILKSTKKMVGIGADYTAFDIDVITHINSVFVTLSQLGIGPVGGYMIESEEEKWSDYLANDYNLNEVRSYMFLKVRLLFDPPATSFAIASMEKLASEFEWRINVHREGEEWTPPTTSSPVLEE